MAWNIRQTGREKPAKSVYRITSGAVRISKNIINCAIHFFKTVGFRLNTPASPKWLVKVMEV